jgi:peroxiredoxin
MPDAGEHVEPFELSGPAGTVCIPDPAGRPTVLMFIQEAGTPTCDTQARSLAGEHELLRELGAVAVCASTDPPERLATLAGELAGRVVVAEDPGGRLASAFGVFDSASRRAQRSAFVIDGDGHITLSIPWYNPMNGAQLASIFEALGLEETSS